MKKFDLKSICIGVIIGVVGLTTVFAAGGIKSATYNKANVFFYGQEVPLQNPLVSIVEEGSNEAKLYMPVRELLEYMNFIVEWSQKDNSIYLTMKGQNNDDSQKTPSSALPQSASFTSALELMQKTGNWSYIERYLPDLTNEEIEHIVNVYNSKHPNPAEHKKPQLIMENITGNTNPNRKKNQVVEVNIPKLNADEYIALDLCDIQKDDSITFDISSDGTGVLFVGFMKDKDSFGTTYFGNGDFYGNKKGSVESTFSVNGFEGKYYFFVRNNGNETMENIMGTVIIESK